MRRSGSAPSRILILCALLLAVPRPAAAEWQFAPFFGWTFKGHTSITDLEFATDDTHRSFGIAVTWLGRGPVGFEGYAVYVPGFFNDSKLHDDDDIVTSSRSYALMGNLVVTTPRSWNEYGLRPYVSGGFGLLRAEQTDVLGALPVSKSLPGANIGGGAVGFLSNRTGLRFDLRFFTTLRTTEDTEGVTFGARTHLRYWTASVGLVLR
jgi:hypothetical protein